MCSVECFRVSRSGWNSAFPSSKWNPSSTICSILCVTKRYSMMLPIASSFYLLPRTHWSKQRTSHATQSLSRLFVRYPTVFTRLLPYVLQLESILDQALMIGDKVIDSYQRVLSVFCTTLVVDLGKSRMHDETDYSVRWKSRSIDCPNGTRTKSTISNDVAQILLPGHGKETVPSNLVRYQFSLVVRNVPIWKDSIPSTRHAPNWHLAFGMHCR